MNPSELYEAAQGALEVLERRRPHKGELLQLAMNVHRVWEEGVDRPDQERVHQTLTDLQEAMSGEALTHVENLSTDDAWRMEEQITRSLRAIEFAQRLWQLREAREIAPRTLAALAGVNYSLIYKLQRAVHAPPSPYTLERLARALDVSQVELGVPPAAVREPERAPRPKSRRAAPARSEPAPPETAIDSTIESVARRIQKLLERDYLVVDLSRLDRGAEGFLRRAAARLAEEPPKTRRERLRLMRGILEMPGDLLGSLEEVTAGGGNGDQGRAAASKRRNSASPRGPGRKGGRSRG